LLPRIATITRGPWRRVKPEASLQPAVGNTYECLLLDFNFCMHAAKQKVHMHRRRRFTTHREEQI